MCIENKAIKILIIEDNLDEAELIQDMILEVSETPVLLTHRSYLSEGLKCLESSCFDVILLDIRLPDNDNLDCIQQIKQQAPTTPIVVLTNVRDKQTAIEAVRQGAQDYLYKGQFDCELLIRAIRYAMERQQIEEQLRQQKEELQKQIERERLMGRMIESIRKSLETRDILATTVTEVRQFLNADRVLISCCRDPNSTRIVSEAMAEKWQNQPIPTLAAWLTPNFSDYSPENLAQLLEAFTNSVLTVPIWQNDPQQEPYLWGQLIVQNYRRSHQWHDWEREFINQLANSVAIAIQQSELYQTVQRQAMLDGLTGIANRRQFDLVLEKEWQRLLKQKETKGHCGPISLIMCDVDFFKDYNSCYGHLGGDDCLKQVAKAIAYGSQRSSDIVARYGGEEFAVILPDTDTEGALTVAKNIQSVLESQEIRHFQSPINDYVTLSMGIATHTPEPGEDRTILIDHADQALHQAKTQGRNQIILYQN